MAILECQETLEKSSSISIRRVLFATDFSAPSEAAFPYATAICRRFQSTLHVAHTLSDINLPLISGAVDYVDVDTVYDDARTLAENKIRGLTDRLGTIPFYTHLGRGPVRPNLTAVITDNDIDLIVLGTHGRTGAGKILLGSVAEDILRHAPCPVLTVGPKVRGRARLPYLPTSQPDLAPVDLDIRQILYSTNLCSQSMLVAPVALALAEDFEASLTLLHVFESYPDLSTKPGPIETAVQQLQALIPRKTALAYAAQVVTEFGPAARCILDTAARREVDLIVMGARPADFTTHLPWTTVHEVLAHATCPVLTVPASRGDL